MTWFLKNIYIGIIILFCWNEFLGFRYSTYNKSIYKVPIPYIFFANFRFHFYHRNSLQNIIKFNWQNSLQYPTIQILRSMINVQKAKILQSCNFGNIHSVLKSKLIFLIFWKEKMLEKMLTSDDEDLGNQITTCIKYIYKQYIQSTFIPFPAYCVMWNLDIAKINNWRSQ